MSDLERDNQDATIAKALLRIFEEALAVHVAERHQLIKELQGRPPREGKRNFQNFPHETRADMRTQEQTVQPPTPKVIVP